MRQVINLNNGWKFTQDSIKSGMIPTRPGIKWKSVDLPHTWNALDGQDGGFDYYRGQCWYMTSIDVNLEPDEVAYLEFMGAEAVADVYVNDVKVCTHKGGFSTFRCDITPFIKRNKAKITVSVDNSESKEVYPQNADFTFYGGLYRDVNLIITDRRHFDLDYYGTPGIAVTPTVNADGSADVLIDVYTPNLDSECEIIVETAGMTQTIPYGQSQCTFNFQDPHLWNGRKDPYLYTVAAKIVRQGKVLDNVSQRYGIRTFSVDPEKGFFLNGKSYPLHGVSRHQDRENMGWAITEKEHRQDMELIAEVGANTIRLAHYQHSQTFYDLCDEYGMIVWAEIPFISSFMPGEAARNNTLSQMKELVLQNYNHPSIVCWGIANEITIGGENPELIDNLHALNDLCHSLDKTRLTTIANLTMVEIDSVLNSITDILSYNHYFGWYVGDVADNGPWFDEFHAAHPDRCLGLSEYGCEGILKYHTDDPKVQDYTEEYQAYYHEEMLKTFASRPYLWSTHVWNMFDFGSDMRDEGGVKGRNNKGLVTYDRKTKKDSFYIYKAYWTSEHFVHICGRRYFDRASDTITVKVYSNCGKITLDVNGQRVGTVQGDKVFVFENVPLNAGINTLKAFSDDCQDFIELNRVDAPNESYVLKSANGSGSGNVANWFESMSSEGELEFKEGYFSINDKLGDIMKTEQGNKFVSDMVDKVSEAMNMSISKGMMNMAKGFTVVKVFDMAGSRVPDSAKVWVNQELQKIPKN
ncbi:MAG: beta-galactosidase [Clostridiales bacterium]|nr:beta-galactosidase [Clostridiales bacterium]